MAVTGSSVSSYHQLLNSGVMASQYAEITAFVIGVAKRGGDCTLKEISRGTGIEINAVSGRVNWLKNEDRAFLIESTPRKCTVTGRVVTPLTCSEYVVKTYQPKKGRVSKPTHEEVIRNKTLTISEKLSVFETTLLDYKDPTYSYQHIAEVLLDKFDFQVQPVNIRKYCRDHLNFDKRKPS